MPTEPSDPESPTDKLRRLARAEPENPPEPADKPTTGYASWSSAEELEALNKKDTTQPRHSFLRSTDEPPATPPPLSPEALAAKRALIERAYAPPGEPSSTSPTFRKVNLDENGMPRLSSRRTEPEPIATRRATRQPVPPPEYPSAKPPTGVEPPRHRSWLGCLWQLIRFGLVSLIVLIFLAAGALIFGYWYIARDLPPLPDLRARASQFETTRVYDSKGNLLYQIVDPQAGRRTRVPLSKISPYLLAATLATEDKNFYSHPGFDPVGIIRAIWQSLRAGEAVSGASTITQQLVRALVLTPEESAQRTALRKIREIILAAEITRQYSRDEILELYLNEIYYGNLAYGIEAASETYFNKPASDLTLSEAAFLAGLPQSPAIYDVFTNREAAFTRQQQVLILMLELSTEANCIPVSTGAKTETVCVKAEEVPPAVVALQTYPFTPPKSDARFPHWVNYIRQLLEDQYGAQTLYRSGYSVYTTLDPDLQTLGETVVYSQVTALADKHVTNGALVALRPGTGEILVMVGSADYNNPVDGQINMAIRPRQPGSSIKPLTYAFTFERGWNPATLIWDVPTDFPDGANPPYKPVNYDGRFHGPTLMRYALANSYNIPAVKALQFLGIYGDNGFIKFVEQFGITTLTRNDYGLSLSLGGGEIPPLEMAGAYGALANGGRRVFPVAIRQITDANGKVICQQPLSPADLKNNPPACQTPPDNWGRPLVSPETAFLISDVLADNKARTPAFGPNSLLLLSFPAAVKTGTTNEFYDNWTIGYTPNLVTAVWVGNADHSPMEHTTGVTGAAPIWHAFMEGALGGGRAVPFVRPQGIIEKTICGLSGAEPSESCPPDTIRTEVFAANNGPLPKERDLRQKAFIDPFTGLRQSAACAKYYQGDLVYDQEKVVINVTDPSAQKWLTQDPNGQTWAAEHGITPPIAWAPPDDCKDDSPHPMISFAYPAEGATLQSGPVQILGQAAATKDFDHYIVEYGLSRTPGGWGPVLGHNTNPVPETGKLADWNTNDIDGEVTLRIIVFNKSGGSAEARVHFTVRRPTPTPTPTPTITLTPVPSQTATATPTLPATFTPTVTVPATTTSTPLPTETPTPEALPTETPTPPPPTETPTPGTP